MLPEPDRGKARVGIRWHTGATDEITTARAVHPGTAKRTPSPAAALICELGSTTSNDELVTLLAERGYTTGHGRPFDVKAVQWVRHVHHIPTPGPYRDGELSVNQVAERLRCNPGVVYYWIETGHLHARRGAGNRLCIPWNPRIQADFQNRINSSSHLTPTGRATTSHGR